MRIILADDSGSVLDAVEVPDGEWFDKRDVPTFCWSLLHDLGPSRRQGGQ